LIAAVSLFLGAGTPSNRPRNPDEEFLQGTWAPAYLEVNAKQMPVENLKDARLSVRGERYTFTMGVTRLEMTYRMDAAQKPRAIDMTITAGPDKGKVLHGIYEFKGETFKICRHVLPDKERPTGFATRPESGLTIIVWKRVKV
jgi:uncharacterized protein (TIGR03067 family)